jgi:hypothetical protein
MWSVIKNLKQTKIFKANFLKLFEKNNKRVIESPKNQQSKIGRRDIERSVGKSVAG